MCYSFEFREKTQIIEGDRLSMTIAVDWDIKQQQNEMNFLNATMHAATVL